jgi:hypothetical protein
VGYECQLGCRIGTYIVNFCGRTPVYLWFTIGLNDVVDLVHLL